MNRLITNPLFKIRNFIDAARLWRTKTRISNTIIITVFAGFSLSCLLLLLIVDYHQEQQSKLIDAYGNALNQLTTNQLKVSMSNNNLIGLQSILNDLVDQTKAINAIVYGVDNKILVQAGEFHGIDSVKAYTFPITIDDALLGSLTININGNVDNGYWLAMCLLSLFGALLLMLLCMLHKTKKDIIVKDAAAEKKTSEKGETSANGASKDNTSISTPVELKHLEPQHLEHQHLEPKYQALLLIDFHTLDKLHQQLNAEARENEIKKLRSAMNKILTLYSGKKIAASLSNILIGFENKDQKDCIFNALCCAYLLKQACLKQQWLIRFSSHIHDQEGNISISDLTQLRHLNHHHSSQDNCGIFIKRRVIQHNQLEDRFTLNTSSESEYNYITGLSKTYEKLIKSQLSYIL